MEDSPSAFVERWTQQVRALQAELAAKSSSTTSASELAQRLSQQLTSWTGDLPLSEQARCERELKSLQESLAALKTQSAPKSKFSFKRSALSAVPAVSSPSPAAPQPAASLTSPLASTSTLSPAASPVPPTALALASRSSAYLSFVDVPSPPSSTSSEPLALSSLSNCLVDLLSSAAPSSPSSRSESSVVFSALYLSRLDDCVVLLPSQDSGSILIQDCRRCVFVLGGHQFRMHDSTDCCMFLQASSTPIIERCRGLAFGGYPAALAPLAALPGGKATSPTPPKTVEDFDDPFATAERPSSNWRLASVGETAFWESQSGWRNEAGRGEGWKELLKAAKKLTSA
ncbi:hypothetical protein JCM11251_004100 [Rhodosporidiobolus azoricus]